MYIGIDVGGTNLSAGITDADGKILASVSDPLGAFDGAENFAKRLCALAEKVTEKANLSIADIESVGIGVPGAAADGKILYTCNIPMKDVPLAQMMQRQLKCPVLLGNDADCAAVGEFFCGAGRGTRNFIVITLGTGIGGGLILGGKLYTAMGSAGEVGHMVIQYGGRPCNCGRSGCWETYASATGLVNLAREALEKNPESLLARAGGKLNGKTVFDAAGKQDAVALGVCEEYVAYLAAGIVNLANILQPEAVALGGGVSGAPDPLLLWPLRKLVDAQCYSAHTGRLTRIIKTQLGNDAGIIGAALLGRAV